MEGMEDMEDLDIMERDLLKLMLSQDTSEEDMVAMVIGGMEVMGIGVDMDTMARGRLKLWLKLMLSQDTFQEVTDMEDMVMEVMEDMVMAVDTMARGRPKLMLSQDI